MGDLLKPRRRAEIPDDEWNRYEWAQVQTISDPEPRYVADCERPKESSLSKPPERDR